jgi:antitoxin MazE
MTAANLTLDQEVEVREEAGRIVIAPVRPAEYRLADLIAGITDENRHDEVDFGPPVGTELLWWRRRTFPMRSFGSNLIRNGVTSKRVTVPRLSEPGGLQRSIRTDGLLSNHHKDQGLPV